MNHTRMTTGQGPDEFYIIDSYHNSVNTSIPPEGCMDRQYEAFYCKPCCQIRKVFEETMSKGGISISLIFDG